MSSATTPSEQRRGRALPLWREVELSLRRDIQSGKIGPGDKLPTEVELCAHFGVHRNTVRHALAALRERNLVRVEQGRGAFVKERVVSHKLGAQTRLTAALREAHRIGERHFIGSSRVRMSKEVAAHLRLSETHFARKIDTLTTVDGMAVSIASHYFPLPRFEGIEKIVEETGSFSNAWSHYGVLEYKRLESIISAVGLSAADAKIMNATRGQPVVHLTNVNIDSNGVPIVVATSRVVPQRMELTIQFS